ncbi:MAG: PAS domain-containing protein [Eubacteriales bacterium]|nr:PAS domain-containing protein [Eubacteriales bacterium]
MSEVLNQYIPIVRFLGAMLGQDVEIVLYDMEDMKVLWVENAFDSDMKPGSEMRSIEKNMIAKKIYKKKDSELHYRTMSKEKHYKLTSSTHFIKDEKKAPVGVLTFNYRVDQLIEARNLLETLVNGPGKAATKVDKMFFENIEDTADELIKNKVSEEIQLFNKFPEKFTYHEKMLLMQRLEKNGVLLMKGSVAEIARQLRTTETSIYRYITKLNES